MIQRVDFYNIYYPRIWEISSKISNHTYSCLKLKMDLINFLRRYKFTHYLNLFQKVCIEKEN